MADNIFDGLGRVYQTWLRQNGLPDMDAEELVMDSGCAGYTLTDPQRRWVSRFIDLWLATED